MFDKFHFGGEFHQHGTPQSRPSKSRNPLPEPMNPMGVRESFQAIQFEPVMIICIYIYVYVHNYIVFRNISYLICCQDYTPNFCTQSKLQGVTWMITLGIFGAQ